MKITKSEFKELIKESINEVLNEDKFENAAKKGKGLYISITYSLSRFSDDVDYDDMFDKLAKKYGGEQFGSGGGFGGRDLNYGFLDANKAYEFVKQAKILGKKYKLKVEKTHEKTLNDYLNLN